MSKTPMLEDLHSCLRDPERPYPFFSGGCPAPLKLSLPGIVFTELCGACPMQGEGRVNGLGFSFWARHGRWEMQIDQPGNSPARLFSGDDCWDGHMPPSVAFALVVGKLLYHVCGQDQFGSPSPGMWPMDPRRTSTGSWGLRRSEAEVQNMPSSVAFADEVLLIGELEAILDSVLECFEFPDGLPGIDYEAGVRTPVEIFLPPGTIRDPVRMEARHPGLKIKRTEKSWAGLRDLSDEHLVDLHTWLCFHDDWQASDLRGVHNAVLVEAKRRRWPEGWWEDPSIVL